MRVTGYIFSAAFVMLFSFLHIHPLLVQREMTKEAKTEVTKEAKKENPCAKKSKCQKQIPPCKKETSDKKDNCDSAGCNPFVPCAIGYCCYLVENFYSYTIPSILTKEKIVVVNDNRLSNNLSECWHPPELLS